MIAFLAWGHPANKGFCRRAAKRAAAQDVPANRRAGNGVRGGAVVLVEMPTDAAKPMKALIVVTSAERLDESHATGVWLDEYATVFTALCEGGIDVTVASPCGGPAPIDPKTAPDEAAKARWRVALEALIDTRVLSQVETADFDAVVFPGGHGPLIDLALDPQVASLASAAAAAGRIIGALCHGPAALLGAHAADGATALVAGRRITAFTNGEEALAGMQGVVPFLLETRLRDAGARFEHALLPGACHVVRDGDLITGQNPASSAAMARCLLEALAERQRAALAA
jgi:putative intracellular protease/amidase